MNSHIHFQDQLDTPLGKLTILAEPSGISQVAFGKLIAKEEIRPNQHTEQAKLELASYFEGHKVAFSVPLNPQGTEFQRRVWRALQAVEYGETRSYADIAKSIGNHNAVRAVGAANGKNPIAIIVPCHRVIGSNGTLTGYAGGLDRKAWLLALESNRHN